MQKLEQRVIRVPMAPLAPYVLQILPFREIEQELRATIPEMADAFAQLWVFRYGFEDFKTFLVRGDRYAGQEEC